MAARAPNPNVPQIPAPVANLGSLVNVAQSLKQGVDSLAGNRGGPLDRAVTLNDLVSMGLITKAAALSATGGTTVGSGTTAAAVSGSSTLAGDSDVAISSPATGQVLTFNGTKWANEAPATGGAGGSSGSSYPKGLLQLIDFTTATGPVVEDLASNWPVFIAGYKSASQSAAGYTTDGSSTFIHATKVAMGRYSFTIAVRFKTTQSSVGQAYWNDPTVYGLALNAVGNDAGITVHNGYAAFWCSPASNASNSSDYNYVSAKNISDGNWHTAVLVCDGASIHLYVDGTDAGISYPGPINFPYGDRAGYNNTPSLNGCYPELGRCNSDDFDPNTYYGGLAATFSQLRVYDYGMTAAGVAALDLTTTPSSSSGVSSYSRPALGSMTWLNQGGATATDCNGGPLVISAPTESVSSPNWSILAEQIPSAPWTFTARLKLQLFNAQYNQGCICLVDTAGRVITFELNNDTVSDLCVSHFNNATSYQSNPMHGGLDFSNPIWLRIVNDGTNFTFLWSYSGWVWQEFWSESVSAWLGALAYVGFGITGQGAPAASALELWDWEVASGANPHGSAAHADAG